MQVADLNSFAALIGKGFLLPDVLTANITVSHFEVTATNQGVQKAHLDLTTDRIKIGSMPMENIAASLDVVIPVFSVVQSITARVERSGNVEFIRNDTELVVKNKGTLQSFPVARLVPTGTVTKAGNAILASAVWGLWRSARSR